jgi:hypothetical protein
MFDIHEQIVCKASDACDAATAAAATAVGTAAAAAATAARGNRAGVPAALTESDSLLSYSFCVHETDGARGAAGRLQAESISSAQQQKQQLAAGNSLSMLRAALLSSDESGRGSSDSGSGSDTDVDDGEGSARRTGSSGSSSICTNSALENLKTALLKQRRLQQRQQQQQQQQEEEEQEQEERERTVPVSAQIQPQPQQQQEQQQQPSGVCSIVLPGDGAAVAPAVFRSETPDSDCGGVLAAAAAAIQAAG